MKCKETYNILGANTAVTDMNKTFSFLTDNLEELQGSYICVSNVYTTVTAYKDVECRKIQNEAAIVLPDEKPFSVVYHLHS